MRLSERWLREWINSPLTIKEIAHQFTAGGLEVASITSLSDNLEQVVVGRVLAVVPHPHADRLKVCTVDVGDGHLSIVCGAPNVVAGMRAPLAPIGTTLPGGLQIKKTKIRGEWSFGMLCSPAELGLASDSFGIMALGGDPLPGSTLVEHLSLNDHVIELEITPNRGDCLSVRGAARDLAALTRTEYQPLTIEPVPAVSNETWEIRVSAPEDCPRYVGRVIRGFNNRAHSPLWLTEKLRRCGIRSLTPAVDVTNYVLLELGQPLHAFNLEKLRGGVEIRRAGVNEPIMLLNGQSAILDPDFLVVADSDGPVAIAGIMGGTKTEVSPNTTDILLESAFFAPQCISGRARRLKLLTEASYRFERGVDPSLQVLAIERATALLLDIGGGVAGPVTEVAAPHPVKREPVSLRRERLWRILGTEVSDAETLGALRRLEFTLDERATGIWQVGVPQHRFDINAEEDLIEEVARVYGYDRIPISLPSAVIAAEDRTSATRIHRFAEALVQRGYHEAITYSFVSEADCARLSPNELTVRIINPLAGDRSVMRPSLWPGLVGALRYNLNRQQERVRLFEIGSRFRLSSKTLTQDTVISGIISGQRDSTHWSIPVCNVDFFDIKGDVEALLDVAAVGTVYFDRCRHPGLHPGQAAVISRQGQAIGILGRLNPGMEQELGLNRSAYVFEIELAAIRNRCLPTYQPVSQYPVVHRDLAVIVPEQVTAAQLGSCMTATIGSMLKNLIVFDVYRGKGIAEGHKSVATRLTFSSSLGTLADENVDKVMADTIARLATEFGGKLRD